MAVNLDPLLEGKSFDDLIRAQTDKALLVRFAIDCARRVTLSTDVKGQAALQAAENWLLDPSEENRRAAAEAAFAINGTSRSATYATHAAAAYRITHTINSTSAAAIHAYATNNDLIEHEWQFKRFMEIFSQ